MVKLVLAIEKQKQSLPEILLHGKASIWFEYKCRNPTRKKKTKETAVEEDASRTRGTNPHESYPQACCPERP